MKNFQILVIVVVVAVLITLTKTTELATASTSPMPTPAEVELFYKYYLPLVAIQHQGEIRHGYSWASDYHLQEFMERFRVEEFYNFSMDPASGYGTRHIVFWTDCSFVIRYGPDTYVHRATPYDGSLGTDCPTAEELALEYDVNATPPVYPYVEGVKNHYWRVADYFSGGGQAEKIIFINEPDIESQGNRSPAQALEILARLKPLLPEHVEIIGGNSVDADWTLDFLSLNAQHGTSTFPFDILALHFYNQEADYSAAIDDFLTEVDAMGYPEVPFWVSEYGSTIPEEVRKMTVEILSNRRVEKAFIFTSIAPRSEWYSIYSLFDFELQLTELGREYELALEEVYGVDF